MNLKPLAHRILEDYPLRWDGIHGVGHWARVLENGLRGLMAGLHSGSFQIC
jgi:hypothetical protein